MMMMEDNTILPASRLLAIIAQTFRQRCVYMYYIPVNPLTGVETKKNHWLTN